MAWCQHHARCQEWRCNQCWLRYLVVVCPPIAVASICSQRPRRKINSIGAPGLGGMPKGPKKAPEMASATAAATPWGTGEPPPSRGIFCSLGAGSVWRCRTLLQSWSLTTAHSSRTMEVQLLLVPGRWQSRHHRSFSLQWHRALSQHQYTLPGQGWQCRALDEFPGRLESLRHGRELQALPTELPGRRVQKHSMDPLPRA